MIASCGMRVQGRSVKTDEDVVEWMGEEEQEEEEEVEVEAWLCG